MPVTLVDTHTHLESFVRRHELAAVLQRAAAAGVEKMIAVGTSPDDWSAYRETAREHVGAVHFTVGLHPCSVDANWENAVEQIGGYWPTANTTVGMEAGVRPVALGEIGLDRFHLPKEAEEAQAIFEWQQAAFAGQLAIAKRLGCPIVIHSRGAFRECVEMIDASGVDWARVVFHCFAEGSAEMDELVRRGGRGSFTGILTYKSADNVRRAARALGLERLMLETDAPYLAPMPHRGKPNEPGFVRHTAEFAAKEVFGVPVEELAEVTTRNACAFFEL